ncbi:MAG TPA: hypothetical protein VF952_19650 [Chloroflexia bacterium]
MNARTLGEMVTVRGHFYRSVQVARDWKDGRGLQEYLLTPTAHDLTAQILAGLQASDGARAWSITGPYGTGKSAFALFLTDLLAQTTPTHAQGRALRHDVGFEAAPFVPILGVGQRAPLVPTFLAALADGIQTIAPAFADSVREIARQSARPNDMQVADLLEQAASYASSAGHGGLLVILDEFGKLLEYAALHPESEDLLVLQHIAEVAARSSVPILLLTILHTSFADYLDSVDELHRREWQKVQGRFLDVAFQEPSEQLLRLVGSAIERTLPAELQTAYSQDVEGALQSAPLAEAKRRLPALLDLAMECTPLHPTAALLLWPLFRSKLAQNERSLFAFLTGREPYGFQEFLSITSLDPNLYGDKEGQSKRASKKAKQALGLEPPFYRLNLLYDYVTTALGASIYRGDRARRWAEIENALQRVASNAPPLAQAVVKVVGLVGLYGAAVGVHASQELVGLALGDPTGVADALAYLQQASILVYRRHEDAFGLWEGSDVDLEACIQEARSHAGQGRLAARLKQVVNLRPIVARAHYIKTGTLRYFNVDIVDASVEALQEALSEPVDPADGQILYVLTRSTRERQTLLEVAQRLSGSDASGHTLRIIAFPKPMAGLEETLLEVESWQWVSEHVKGLQGDPVARQEVKARVLHASERLENIAGVVLGLRGYLLDPTMSDWVQSGRLRTPGSARGFQQWISGLCDQAYPHAPVLRNELLNRNRLSSSAAKARRNLLEAMLAHEGEPDLGFVGNPPEASMYRSLLLDGGFHAFRQGQLQLGEPHPGWQPLWQAIGEFLNSTKSGRRPVQELYALLRRPPFGMRDGPLPVLLCAALLTHRDEVALYDGGVFVSELRIEVLERLLRVPEALELRRLTLSKEDRETVVAIREVLETLQMHSGPARWEAPARAAELMEVVKPLVVFAARLPAYTKQTRRLDPPQAAAVRDALLKARDPYTLAFVDLPLALGISPSEHAGQSDTLLSLLKECLLGLRRAYPQLLDQIEAQIREVFDLHGTSAAARLQLQTRAQAVDGSAADPLLALFVREASRPHTEDRDWREILGRVLNSGIPPMQWRDSDVIAIQLKLRQIASDFVRLEELVAEKRRTGAAQVLRVGVLNGYMKELRGIVSVTPERTAATEDLENRIVELLGEQAHASAHAHTLAHEYAHVHQYSSEEFRRICIAALARVAVRYLQDPAEDNAVTAATASKLDEHSVAATDGVEEGDNE